MDPDRPQPAPNPSERVVIVADAHVLGPGTEKTDQALLDFLAAVPDLGDRLIINGDLFDFWFEYRAVIPSKVFPWLAALRNLRDSGIPITLTGGNHDRWGGKFWPEQMDIRFEPAGFEDCLAGFKTRIHHGDGLSEDSWTGALLHRITRNPLTEGLFRLIHPDFGYRLVTGSYNKVRKKPDAPTHRKICEAQIAYARKELEAAPDLDLLVLSHVHEAVLVEVGARKWFLNPGPWQEEQRYAMVSPTGPELKVWT